MRLLHYFPFIALYLVGPAQPVKQCECATHTGEKCQHYNITGLPSPRRRVGARDGELGAGPGCLRISSVLPSCLLVQLEDAPSLNSSFL